MYGVEAAARLDPRWFAKRDRADVMLAFYGVARRSAPVVVESVEAIDAWRLIAHGTARRFPVAVSVTVDPESRQISRLTLLPEVDALSLDDIERVLPTLAPEAQLLVAELDGGACVPLYAVDPDRALPIASAHKLYTLLALADHIAAGEATWDTPLAIRDAWRSRDFGAKDEELAGTSYPLLMFARAMIERSDNTATDHLLYYLGREALEEAMQVANHATPERNIPFLSTRELFFLRRLDGAEVRRYLASSPEQRRTYVDSEIKPRPIADLKGSDGSASRYVGEIGWFANATDLCRVMATLEARARAAPENEILLDILALSPGAYTEFDEEPWSFIGYKGGDLPGVYNNTWLLQRADGRRFVVTLGFNDPSDELPDRSHLTALTARLLDLLAGLGEGEPGRP